MRNSRNIPFRLGGLVVGALAAVVFFGCPPPQTVGPGDARDPEVSQRTLDSLRADSAQKCRFHRSFAYNYARSGLQKDAMDQFQKALVFCDDEMNAEISRMYARYLDDWGMTDSALVYYKKAARLDTTNSRVHFWLYSYYHEVGDYDAAIDNLIIAARHHEDRDTKIRYMRAAADMMVAEGQVDRACETYAHLQSIAPECPEIAEAMVSANCVQDPEQLLNTLRAACAADPLGEICKRLAREEETFGSDREALNIYLRLAAHEETNISLWEDVLRTSRRTGETETTLRALQKLAGLETGCPDRAGALIGEFFAQGRYSDGARVLLPALRSNPDCARLLYLAGRYYTRPNTTREDSTRALEHLDRAVRTNDPNWRRTALELHDSIEPPLSEEEINQAVFFGRRVDRLHRCTIPGRESQNRVLDQ